MPYALVIFDFDGTLADSAGWFYGVFNEVARRYRFREIVEADVERLRGQHNRAILRHLGVPLWKLPLIARHMRKLMARDLATIAPFPGVPDMLAALHRAGVRIAIVSSNAEANVRGILGAKAAGLIDDYGCGTSMFGKEAKFRSVLRHAGLGASDAIAIGDESRDIEAAAALGIASGAVAWGYATTDLLRATKPTLMFERVEDILPAVLQGRPAPGDPSIVPLT